MQCLKRFLKISKMQEQQGLKNARRPKKSQKVETEFETDEEIEEEKEEEEFSGSNEDESNYSSIVYWGHQDNFKPVYLFIFFDENISRAQKHITSKNQLTEQK